MFCYFGIKSWRPRSRKHSDKGDKAQRRLDLREKRKRNISEPIPIVKSSAAVERLLRFRDNNNVFLLTDGSSISESPCHHGCSRLFSSETSSLTTGYANSDNENLDDSVFVDSITVRLRSGSVGAQIPPKPPRLPPKPPRMRQTREFVCQNPNCCKSEVLLGRTQVLFKSCNFCFTHYCSAKCQNESWKEHKKVCFYGNIDSNLQKVENTLKEDDVNYYFSKLAHDGYASKGRGCLFIVFSSPLQLEEFLKHKIAGVRLKPSYSALKDVFRRGVSNRYRKKLIETIASYEPATEYVINMAVVVGQKAPNNPVPRNREVTVRKIITAQYHEDFAAGEAELGLLRECQNFRTKQKLYLNKNVDRRKSI